MEIGVIHLAVMSQTHLERFETIVARHIWLSFPTTFSFWINFSTMSDWATPLFFWF